MTRRKPVFGLDIDGTLGEYHRHFFSFAAGWLGREIDMHYDGRLPMARHIGVSKERYRQIKLAYRNGGLKRSMPAYPWASQLTRTLRSWGGEVWLCTTRPYLSHDNIDADTRHWVRRNGIACNGVIWGEHKYRELAATVGKERVVCALDDLPEMCSQAMELGISPVLALREHNLPIYEMTWPVQGMYVATEYEDTLLIMKELHQKWRGK